LIPETAGVPLSLPNLSMFLSWLFSANFSVQVGQNQSSSNNLQVRKGEWHTRSSDWIFNFEKNNPHSRFIPYRFSKSSTFGGRLIFS
jgi:hypothetical protein